ncbi:MipA/OmpV family protein [Candidatus Halobeggiatoa sp. HSG11]|nr:MipA/OmpV family protein [Candidatus Halobeggiatoa sp. HSG11]
MRAFYQFISMFILGLSPVLLAAPYQKVDDGWHGIAGSKVILRNEPYKDVNTRILPLPYLVMRRGNFFIDGLKVGYRIAEGTSGRLDLLITPRLEGFDADDSYILNGMGDRDFTLDAGIDMVWKQGLFDFNLSVLNDIVHKSEGREVIASISRTFILTDKKLILTPNLGLRWQSENLVNHYYGVNPTQARTDRPAYIGESTMNYIASLDIIYSLSKRSNLFMAVEYESLGDDVYDSPLVDKERIISLLLGYGWQF